MHTGPTFSPPTTATLLTSKGCDRFREHLSWMPDMLILSTFGLKHRLKVFESCIHYFHPFASYYSLLLFPSKCFLFGNPNTIFDDVLILDFLCFSSQDWSAFYVSDILGSMNYRARKLTLIFFLTHSKYQYIFLILHSNSVF